MSDIGSLPVWALVLQGFTEQSIEGVARRPKEINFLDPNTDNIAFHYTVLFGEQETVGELLKADMSAEVKNRLHLSIPLPLGMARCLVGTFPC